MYQSTKIIKNKFTVPYKIFNEIKLNTDQNHANTTIQNGSLITRLLKYLPYSTCTSRMYNKCN